MKSENFSASDSDTIQVKGLAVRQAVLKECLGMTAAAWQVIRDAAVEPIAQAPVCNVVLLGGRF
jgi:hypothetical protein